MAIVKVNKRLGPFDISGGVSRGDFKSSAYHKTDKDPRFKQQSNNENTVGRFRAAMNAAEGYARLNRFAVRIFPPLNLDVLTSQAGTSIMRAGDVLTPEDTASNVFYDDENGEYVSPPDDEEFADYYDELCGSDEEDEQEEDAEEYDGHSEHTHDEHSPAPIIKEQVEKAITAMEYSLQKTIEGYNLHRTD